MREDARLVQLPRTHVYRVRDAGSERFRFFGKHPSPNTDSEIYGRIRDSLQRYFCYRGTTVISHIHWSTSGTWVISSVTLSNFCMTTNSRTRISSRKTFFSSIRITTVHIIIKRCAIVGNGILRLLLGQNRKFGD